MGDYYLEHPEDLHGQPKRTIADYVASQGIPVPKRFDSLKDARAARVPIIVRSEHVQDYDGISGLLNSFPLAEFKNASTEDSLKEGILNSFPSAGYINAYRTALRVPLSEFEEQVSISFWELLDGYNRKIIADSAVKGRYHIATSTRDGNFMNYAIVDNGTIAIFLNPPPADFENGLGDVITFYESVRNLPRFDPNHCPVLEVQTVDEKNYFLQYHRTRNFEPSQFRLDRRPNKNEVEASFVRGATPPEGVTCKTTLKYGNIDYNDYEKLCEAEEGSFDFHYFFTFSELMVRRRKLQVLCENPDESLFFSLVVGHLTYSKFFKPGVSVGILGCPLVSDEEFQRATALASATGEIQTIDLHVVSDGRTAYVERV